MTEQRERETICLLYDYVYIYVQRFRLKQVPHASPFALAASGAIAAGAGLSLVAACTFNVLVLCGYCADPHHLCSGPTSSSILFFEDF